jgi:hypothetical protein
MLPVVLLALLFRVLEGGSIIELNDKRIPVTYSSHNL